MTAARVFPLVVMLLAVPFAASAQLRPAPDSTKLWRRTPELHPICQQFLPLRKETPARAQTIRNANQRNASAEEMCRLFRDLLAIVCAAPPEALKQMQEIRTGTSQVPRRVCEAAALGSRTPAAAAPPSSPLRTSPRYNPWPAGDYWLPGERRPGR